MTHYDLETFSGRMEAGRDVAAHRRGRGLPEGRGYSLRTWSDYAPQDELPEGWEPDLEEVPEGLQAPGRAVGAHPGPARTPGRRPAAVGSYHGRPKVIQRRVKPTTSPHMPAPNATEGERAAWWREHVARMSRPALAEALGVNRHTIEKYEAMAIIPPWYRLACAAIAHRAESWSWLNPAVDPAEARETLRTQLQRCLEALS